jgi:hypothetical protein
VQLVPVMGGLTTGSTRRLDGISFMPISGDDSGMLLARRGLIRAFGCQTSQCQARDQHPDLTRIQGGNIFRFRPQSLL